MQPQRILVPCPLLLKKESLATNRQFAHLGFVPFRNDYVVGESKAARAQGWCLAGVQGVGAGGGGPSAGPCGGQAAARCPDSLLPMTSQRGLETDFTSLFCLFHVVLLLSEDQFFCFCFTMSYCHVRVLIFS